MEYSGEVVADLLREVSKELHHLIHESAQDEKTPMVTLILLKNIRHSPGITVSQLSRVAGLAKSHVSRQVDALAKQGWVDKRPDPDDQRQVKLYVTERSLAHYNEIGAQVRSTVAEVMNSVPPQARDSLMKGLLALRTAVHQAKAKRSR